MGAGLRQGSALVKKTLKIILFRHFISTFYSALILPVIAAVYLGIGSNLTNPNSKFGIGDPYAIRSLPDALHAASSARNTVLFVNNGHTGGDIEKVISSLSRNVTDAGFNATTIDNEAAIGYNCRSSFRATSNCFGAVVFYSSPKEGEGRRWNYTLRGDGALGTKFVVGNDNNDPQIYALPLQKAVDSQILSLGGSSSSSLPSNTQAIGWSQQTEAQREAKLRKDYQNSFLNYLSVAFLLALIGVTYHMSGFIATERETGMTQLIDAMMPAKSAFKRQMVRLAANYWSFGITYFPGWIVAGVISGVLVWKKTSMGIIIPMFILAGFSLMSMTTLAATFWKKAQLSGSVTAVGFLVFGIIAQAIGNPPTGADVVLSLLFAPCNFVFMIKYIARYESDSKGANLAKASDSSSSSLPGVIHWFFFIIQIFGYLVLAVYSERWVHGVTTGARNSFQPGSQEAVRIVGMNKTFKPSLLHRIFSFISKPRPEVKAVDNLSLSVNKGQILALLGANGSGKSTTLDAVAGISSFDSGELSIDTSGGLGIAPQKNVLWDELTVQDHVRIFNQLKCPFSRDSRIQIHDLIEAIGLWPKLNAQVKTLSGGQKRKLQLGLMLTGGSAVCCVDEVSSGIDPLSRRKIWDILLAERGSRTIIMTTHFLDEADLLADNIAILSKGKLRAEGSSAELKDKLGAGYRIHVLDARKVKNTPDVEGVEKKATAQHVTYISQSSHGAALVIKALEAAGIQYQFSGPTIEDVFLQVSDEVREEAAHQAGSDTSLRPVAKRNSSTDTEKTRVGSDDSKSTADLITGQPIGVPRQIWVLLRKRVTIFKNEWLPYVVAFAIPIIAAGVTQLLIANKSAAGCSPSDQSHSTDDSVIPDILKSVYVLGGPQGPFGDRSELQRLFSPLYSNNAVLTGRDEQNVTTVGSLSAFKDAIPNLRDRVNPAGWYLGNGRDASTVAYKVDDHSMFTAVLGQNMMNVMLTNQSIATSYKPFDSPVSSSTGDALQVVVYLGVATSVIPGLFGLYINRERLGNMRGLQYSSGARAVSLWLSHTIFDYSMILVSMIVAAAIYNATSDIWYHGGYLFPVFILYGLASLLLSYLFSLFLGSALATYAAVTAFQGVGFAIYMIAYLFILTYSSATSVGRNIEIGHWVISLFFPVGSLVRAMIVSLNAFGAACSGTSLQSNPAAMVAFGGPITYLCLQSVLLFLLLLWNDSGVSKFSRGKAIKSPDSEDPELANELVRVTGPEGEKTDGLRTVHLTKAFDKITAVDNVSFGVEHGEVFALLGPNGAGKSTTISLIRGDLAPSKNGGDVFVENISVNNKRAAARANLGVCPQYDAIDSMTVREHLEFYARLRGISDVKYQVQAVVEAVGLNAFIDVMAHTLSGGNKRKLSLAIALTGNPTVILLDEPSSGLDAAAKRIMWKTLGTIIPGRSILLTTHSMEEADALAHRAGILATRMLALGTTDDLRHRFGDTLHVHLVSKTAPHSSQEEMNSVRDWVTDKFPGAEVEQETYHGQMRFSIPAASVAGQSTEEGQADTSSGSAIGQLLIILEENKERLGIAHHSVSPTTLNQVFLSIVGQHDIQEEGYTTSDPTRANNDMEQAPQDQGSGTVATQEPTDTNQLHSPNQAGRSQEQAGQEAAPPAVEKPRRQEPAKKKKPWYLRNIWEFF